MQQSLFFIWIFSFPNGQWDSPISVLQLVCILWCNNIDYLILKKFTDLPRRQLLMCPSVFPSCYHYIELIILQNNFNILLWLCGVPPRDFWGTELKEMKVGCAQLEKASFVSVNNCHVSALEYAWNWCVFPKLTCKVPYKYTMYLKMIYNVVCSLLSR